MLYCISFIASTLPIVGVHRDRDGNYFSVHPANDPVFGFSANDLVPTLDTGKLTVSGVYGIEAGSKEAWIFTGGMPEYQKATIMPEREPPSRYVVWVYFENTIGLDRRDYIVPIHQLLPYDPDSARPQPIPTPRPIFL